MKKICILFLFLGSVSMLAQERSDLIGRRFEGALTKMAVGDSINTVETLYITFLKDKAIIQQEKLSVTNKPRLIYKLELAWRINKHNNQIIFSSAGKPYPYQEYKYYYREEELMAFYSQDEDGTMGLDIYFTEK